MIKEVVIGFFGARYFKFLWCESKHDYELMKLHQHNSWNQSPNVYYICNFSGVVLIKHPVIPGSCLSFSDNYRVITPVISSDNSCHILDKYQSNSN